MGSLEQELVRVVKTLDELQVKYLSMLEESEDDHARGDPGTGDTLYDYQLKADKLGEWIKETDGTTRMSTLLHTMQCIGLWSNVQKQAMHLC